MSLIQADKYIMLQIKLHNTEKIPCFSKNKTGLILIFAQKYDTRAYFWRSLLFLFVNKQSY